MTTDHRAEAERLLASAQRFTSSDWPHQTGEHKSDIIAAAQVHALLAIHDTLTAADRYAANEAKQREAAEPDPLDEDDHRDRLDRNGDRVRRIDQLSVLLNGDPVEVTIRGARYAMRAISDPQSPDLPYEFRAGRVAYPDTIRIED